MFKAVIFLATLVAVEMSALAQSNPAPVQLRIVTNAPTSFFWQPTPEQKKIEGIVFHSSFNEFDSEVRHSVINLPTNGTGVITLLTRMWGPVKNEFQFVIKRTEDTLRPEEKFDGDGALQFMVDGQRWVFTNNLANATLERTGENHLRTSFYAMITESFVRTLGGCQRASMRVPQKVGNFDYTFTPLELSRFGIFVRAYLPATAATNTIKINSR